MTINKIVLNAITTAKDDWKKCIWCGVQNNHKKTQHFLILPSVLIITLERYQASQFAEVDPSLSLEIDGVAYQLKAVITHHEAENISEGHLTTSLYNVNSRLWKECDDTIIKPTEWCLLVNPRAFLFTHIYK